jgi:hypothetical protein
MIVESDYDGPCNRKRKSLEELHMCALILNSCPSCLIGNLPFNEPHPDSASNEEKSNHNKNMAIDKLF